MGDPPAADGPSRTVLTVDPPNEESPLAALDRVPTPLDRFYLRTNFEIPRVDPDTCTLTLAGPDLPGAPPAATFRIADLKALAPVERRIVLECAGNGRTLAEPPAPGTPWTLGAAGVADFTGIPLATLLRHAGWWPAAERSAEVVFSGADRGEVADHGSISFQRSLPRADALREPDGPLLVWGMNGEPLPPEHGGPLRLVVPGWYAVASVKWLSRIELSPVPFEGWFQTDRYRYLVEGRPPEAVREMRVRALLVSPDPERGGPLAAGAVELRGLAWSGDGPVEEVGVSVDGGRRWHAADLVPGGSPGTPTAWSLRWEAAPGEHEIVVRARDAAGAQPLEPVRNALGYGNNVVQRVRFTVSAG